MKNDMRSLAGMSHVAFASRAVHAIGYSAARAWSCARIASGTVKLTLKPPPSNDAGAIASGEIGIAWYTASPSSPSSPNRTITRTASAVAVAAPPSGAHATPFTRTALTPPAPRGAASSSVASAFATPRAPRTASARAPSSAASTATEATAASPRTTRADAAADSGADDEFVWLSMTSSSARASEPPTRTSSASPWTQVPSSRPGSG